MKVPTARILVTDDDPAVVDTLVTLLGEDGYGVSSAVTSDEGLKLFICPTRIWCCSTLQYTE